MNQFKEDVLKELQDVKLSQQRKQVIAEKARRKVQRKAGGQWTYRIVFTAFTIFVIGFSYILTQQEGQQSPGHQAASLQSDTWHWWSLFASDYIRGMILLSIFIGATFIVKRYLLKKGYGLPVCIECGESWSEKDARKLYRKNSGIVCPHCGQKQYRTKIHANKWCNDDASATADYAAACFPSFCYRSHFLFSGHVLLPLSNCAICV